MNTELKYKTETRFSGIPISSGITTAKVCLFNERRHSNLPIYKVSGEGVEKEKARLRRAVEIAAGRLDVLKGEVAQRIGSAEAEIFSAQKMILEDRTLQQRIIQAIEKDHSNAEEAIKLTLDAYELRLSEVDNEYIKERSTDIGEIKRRLLDVLGNMNPSLQCSGEEHCQRGRVRIVVAEELTPSMTLMLDTQHTAGFITERGGMTSHAAIIARALGIPAVSGIKDIHSLISCGTEVMVNGETGEVIVWPSEETRSRLTSQRNETGGSFHVEDPVPELKVMANISLVSDAAVAKEMKAEGIGLYRTEFEFMAAGHILDEEEQVERYSNLVKSMDGRPVHIRLIDVGGDKDLPFLNIPKEENPYLGRRGSRFLLARPDILKTQARALTRASEYGRINVIYPMIVDLAQFRKLKDLFNQAVLDLPPGQIQHGVMFEVVSACLQAREILGVADFGTIGSNDLIQYLFAVDRNNDLVSGDYDPDRPVFWSLIGEIARAASEFGRPLSVCGELAGDPRYIPKLMELGIKNISVSPRLISDARMAVRTSEKVMEMQ